MRPHCSNSNIFGCFNAIAIVCLTLWLPFIRANAQPEVEWERTYEPENGGIPAPVILLRTENNEFRCVGLYSNNDFYDYDIGILYINSEFELVRRVTLLEDHYSEDVPYYIDGCADAVIASNGDLIITGRSEVRIGLEPIRCNGLLIRVDLNGELVWWCRDNRVGGFLNTCIGSDDRIYLNDGRNIWRFQCDGNNGQVVYNWHDDEWIFSIDDFLLDSTQTLIMSGASLLNGVFIPRYICYQINNRLRWSSYFQDQFNWDNDYGNYICKSRDGGYYSAVDLNNDAETRVSLFKMNEDGELLWRREVWWDDHPGFLRQIITTPDGGFATVEERTRPGVPIYEYLRLRRYDSAGNQLWMWDYPFGEGIYATNTNFLLLADNSYLFSWTSRNQVHLVKTTPDPVSVAQNKTDLLKDFHVRGIFPNPTNNTINISFSLQSMQEVRFDLWSSMGILLDTQGPVLMYPGLHSWSRRMTGQPSGVYFLTLTAGATKHYQKFVLLR